MDVTLTEEEEQLYDRQLRVWGLQSQKRLRAARVLLIGVRGLGSEIAKNLILTGIHSLTLLDDTDVTEEDFSANLFVERSHLGKNRAVSALSRAQLLNPGVEVTAYAEPVFNKTDAFFKDFDLVCATGVDKATILSLAVTCRSQGVKFFFGDVWGMFGCMAADCSDHEYTVMLPMNKLTNYQVHTAEEKSLKKRMIFPPLAEVLDADWKSDDTMISRAETLQPEYLLLLVLLEFHKRKGRKPSPKCRDEDLVLLQDICDSWLPEIGIKDPKKVDSALFSLVFGEVSPVCGIMGGIIAQEVTKMLSQLEEPYNNLFFYNPLSSKGYIDTVP